MDNISFQYPSWYLLLCGLLGLGFALVLYFRDKSFREYNQHLNIYLGILRFLAVSLIAVLLLSPLLKSLQTETKKPIVVIARDASESIGTGLSEAQQVELDQQFDQLRTELQKKYDVKSYAFGGAVRETETITYTDKASNLAAMLGQLYDLYSNQNLGAVILASDGIYNQGSNPIYTGAKLTAPIYTLALGDTIPKKDLILRRVFHNKIAYLGDKFSVQVDIGANNCAGSSTTLTVSKVNPGGNRNLQSIPLTIDKNDYFRTQEILLEADVPGVQRYRIQVNALADEASTANNVRDIFVDVLDARQKILLLAHSPHPDLAALKQSILSNKNYEVEIAYAGDLKVSVADFDFVVLHQLPGKGKDISGVLNQLNTSNTPRLFIVGSQTDFRRLNESQTVLRIDSDGRNTNDVQAGFDPAFSLFTLNEAVKEALPGFAPLVAPFGDFQAGANGEVLLQQRIGRIATDFPLWVLGEERNYKVGVLAAEGLWKWRLFDFLQHQQHNIFDELITKTVQYLSIKEDKRQFRVTTNKNIFNENEGIVFNAELYNESFELINDPEVSLTITDSEGRNFDFIFNRSGNAYELQAGTFPVGNYTFEGKVFSGGQNRTFNGQFSVQPVQLELYETTAQHGLLRLLSKEYGGKMLYPNELADLPTILTEQADLKPVVYQTSRTRSVINIKWIFLLLAGMLALEWFLRRYFGSY